MAFFFFFILFLTFITDREGSAVWPTGGGTAGGIGGVAGGPSAMRSLSGSGFFFGGAISNWILPPSLLESVAPFSCASWRINTLFICMRCMNAPCPDMPSHCRFFFAGTTACCGICMPHESKVDPFGLRSGNDSAKASNISVSNGQATAGLPL